MPTKTPESLFNLCGREITDAVANNEMSLEDFNTIPEGITDRFNSQWLLEYHGSSFWSTFKADVIKAICHLMPVSSVVISKDNSFIVTGSHDLTVQVWDTCAYQCTATLAGHKGYVTSVAISTDNSFIVTASSDKTARVWDVCTGECIATLTDHKNIVSSTIAISTDDSFIVTGSYDKAARVWDAHTGICIATLTGHTQEIASVAISTDNSFIITGGAYPDKTARVWSIAEAVKRMTFNEALALAIMLKPEAKPNSASLLSFLNRLSLHELYSLAACLLLILPPILP
jgi:WD40 repeat protein